MTDHDEPGAISWTDLTVPDAEGIRDFYSKVVGWRSSPVEMGGYSDHGMVTAGGRTVAGICHARGVNADLPPVWLVYIQVADIDASIAAVRAEGGQVVRDPVEMGGGRMAVLRDPAGAVCALYQPH